MRYKLLLFVISPMLSLAYSISSLRHKSTKFILWLFTGFYGYTFTTVSDALDANRIINHFNSATVEPFLSFTGLSSISTSGNLQIVEPAIIWLVRSFTSDFRFLFMVYGLIFGYFLISNIYLVLRSINVQTKWAGLLVLTFAFVISIWEINGWRFWTASQIFVWVILTERNSGKTRWFWLFILPFIHYSFLIMVLIFPLLQIGSKLINYKLAVYAMIAAYFIPSIDLNVSKSLQNVDTEIISTEYGKKQVRGYSNKDYITESRKQAQQNNFYVGLYKPALRLAVFILLSMSIFFYTKLNLYQLRLTSFAVLFFTITILLGKIGISNLSRFMEPAIMISLASIISFTEFYQLRFSAWKVYRWILKGMLFFYLTVELRVGLDRIGIYSFFSNIIIAPFLDPSGNIPIIILIKSFL